MMEQNLEVKKMIIRSQDRYELINCNNISMYQNNKLGKVVIAANNNPDLILGLYSTKEKALKVLDMIEKHINKTNIYDVIATENYCKPYEIEKPFKEVFQMPQDDEVLEDE